MGWFWSIRSLPAMPHAGHLAPLLAQHEFQEAFKNYRDLQFLTRNLQGWADSLGVFGDMLGNRRKAYAERLPQVRAKSRSTPSWRHCSSAATRSPPNWRRPSPRSDGAAFHDARQGELLARLASARAALAALGVESQAGRCA